MKQQIYDIEQLATAINEGLQPKYLFFWGHQPGKDGQIKKTCFSQWYQSPFEVEGVTYKTAEHWMMYQKAILFNDLEMAQKIVDCDSPGEAKDLGRKVSSFDQKFGN